MYSVPECGARVLLNIMSEREEDAIVSGCIRTNSEILPQPETKTMWSGNERYIAAPEYLGFSYESVKSLEALFLDDELGIVVNSGKNLTVRANGRLMIRSDGEIYISGVTHTELRHPNAVKEQAWIALDCGEIRLGGDSIVQSGGIINGSCDSEKSLDILSTRKVVRAVLDMMPITRSTASYENSQVDLQAAACVMDMVQENQMYSFASNETSGKVNTLDESKDSQDDNEMKAEIYVNGLCFEGYVNKTNNETYVSQSRYEELKQTTGFSLVENSEEKGKILSIENIAKKLNCQDVLSSWNQEENLRIVVLHPSSATSHYLLVRHNTDITIKLNVKLDYYITTKEGFKSGLVSAKPFLRNPLTTISDMCISGMCLWEGQYKNQYDEKRNIWYDDFGVDGLINVKVEVIINNKDNVTDSKFEVHVIDNRKYAFDSDVLGGHTFYNKGFNKASTSCTPWGSYIPIMYIFLAQIIENNKYKYNKKELIHVIGHETGHVLGLGDAYKNSEQEGVKITDETEHSIMLTVENVLDNDYEMMIEAWKTKKCNIIVIIMHLVIKHLRLSSL